MLKHVLIVALIVAGIAGGWWFSKRNDVQPQLAMESVTPAASAYIAPSPSSSPTSTPVATKKPAAAKPKATATPKPSTLQAAESYQDVLKTYSVSGYRFQFSNCQAAPGTLTMKIGTKFMLDNRDAVARTIKVGAQTFNLGSYGYAVTSAPSAPGLHYITCNGGGAATITVQP